MRIFVSSQSVDSPDSKAFIQELIAAGHAVEHSPSNPMDGKDPRWSTWYAEGLEQAIASAELFVVVVDGGWDSSTWMAEEARTATVAGLPMYFWNPGEITVSAAGMVGYLQRALPRDVTAAARALCSE